MKALKIFFSCALGAFIGSLVALQFNFFWVFGVALGGFIGYISYEFKTVLSFSYTIGKEFYPKIVNKSLWGKVVINTGKMIIAIFAFIFLLVWRIVYSTITLFSVSLLLIPPAILFPSFSSADIFPTCFVFLFFSILFGLTVAVDSLKYDTFKGFQEDIKLDIAKILLYLNPISVYIFWPCWFLWSFFKKAWYKNIWNVVREFGRFLKKVFVFIHSDIRLICGVDAAIGAIIGWYINNAFIGAFAGGFLGVINYYVVSIKLLKLSPTQK